MSTSCREACSGERNAGRRVTTGFGALLSVRTAAGSLTAAAPLLGAASLAFGLWYAAAAWSLAPYPF